MEGPCPAISISAIYWTLPVTGATRNLYADGEYLIQFEKRPAGLAGAMITDHLLPLIFDAQTGWIAMSELFSVVEIEVGSRCNRACWYCPVALDPRPSVPVKMSPAVFDTLTRQLADMSFDGRISYHFYNEPLLRKDLDRLVSTVDERVPHALQVLYTNGDLLSDHKYMQLRAAGIDYFIVTRHSGGSFPPRPFQVVQQPQDLVLTNRGGMLTELPPASAAVRRQPCFVASEMLIVTVTGDVVLCYEDSRREHVLGNVLEQHVLGIWQQPRVTELRQALARGERSVLPMCSRCSNVAHTRPGLSQVTEPFLNDQATTQQTPIVELKRRSIQERRRQARPS